MASGDSSSDGGGDQPKRRGRPPGARSQAARDLRKTIAFRVTAEDYAAYERKVELAGSRKSTFFRDVVLSNRTTVVAPRRQSKDYQRLVYLFAKASNNINQLAHRANSDALAGMVSQGTYEAIQKELADLAAYMKSALRDGA